MSKSQEYSRKIITIAGSDAEKFVQYIATNDVRQLDFREGQYTFICQKDGGILDDAGVWKKLDTRFFFAVNRDSHQKIYEWFCSQNLFLADIILASDISWGQEESHNRMTRVETGCPRYGYDIDETTNPIEAGFEKLVSFDKGDFIGKSALEKALALRRRGGGRFFHGFVFDAPFVPEDGYQIFAESLIPSEIGKITSVEYSARLQKWIALGYLQGKYGVGDAVWIGNEEQSHRATISVLPFKIK